MSEEDLDESLYPIICAKCGHIGEDHCNPGSGGMCCVGIGSPGLCPCSGFLPPRMYLGEKWEQEYEAQPKISETEKARVSESPKRVIEL